MKVTFPAMQGQIGQRTYYSCLMKLNAIPKMFTFRDWAEFTPEEREQRILNKKRVPEIAKYILDNEDGYLFASITASYKCAVQFKPVNGSGLGELEMEFEDANFVINDGQHRCAAIAHAIKENPDLGEETISVLLFPYENRERVQQMFSDLNRFVVKTSKSLDILYDKRDVMSLVTLDVSERVPVFKNMVDKDAVSLPIRSPKLFSLAALYDANEELLKNIRVVSQPSHEEMVRCATEFWTELSKAIPAWTKVKNGDLKALELRQESISSHAVVLRALGATGADLLKEEPEDWKARLMDLTTVDWSKKNWENVCVVANSVVSNRQARFATKACLKRHLKLPLNEAEERALLSSQPDTAEMHKVAGLAEKMTQSQQADLVTAAEQISEKVN
jgi:DNA sulfur modification protein DndB